MMLAVFATTAAYSATPLAAGRCLCDHPADAPCDCPHMKTAVMPCHRHPHRAPPHRTRRSGVSAHCGMTHPALVLLATSPLPEPPAAIAVRLRRAPAPAFSPRPCERFLEPPNPPPKLG